MPDSHEENLMRAAFEPARGLEPSTAQVAQVVARVRERPGRSVGRRRLGGWQRLIAPGLATLALAAGLYAVPTTRAAIEGAAATVAEAFSGYSRGETSDAPGRALQPAEDAPEYFGDTLRGRPFARDQRVLAEAGGYKLYAYRAPSGSISFDLGNTGFGMGFESVEEFDDGAIYVLGPGSMRYADAQGHVPLFGIAADSVSSVELRYESGPPLRFDGVEGGFVLLAEPERGPHEVVAFDAGGETVERESVDYPDGEPGNSWERYIRPLPKVRPHP